MNKYLIFSAAVLALLPAAAKAQDASMAAPTAAPMMAPTPAAPLSTNAFEVTPSPDSERLNYGILNNDTFSQIDIEDAKAAHLNDRQIARIYLIAKYAGVKFRDVFALVRDGYTFSTLAYWYEESLKSVDDSNKAEDEIDSYESAFAATGTHNLPRPGRVESSIDSIRKPISPM